MTIGDKPFHPDWPKVEKKITSRTEPTTKIPAGIKPTFDFVIDLSRSDPSRFKIVHLDNSSIKVLGLADDIHQLALSGHIILIDRQEKKIFCKQEHIEALSEYLKDEDLEGFEYLELEEPHEHIEKEKEKKTEHRERPRETATQSPSKQQKTDDAEKEEMKKLQAEQKKTEQEDNAALGKMNLRHAETREEKQLQERTEFTQQKEKDEIDKQDKRWQTRKNTERSRYDDTRA